MALLLIQAIFIIVGSIVGITMLALGLKIFFADENCYEANKNATQNFKNALKGTIPTMREGSRGFLISAGLALDTKNNKIEPQGALSDEAIANVLR